MMYFVKKGEDGHMKLIMLRLFTKTNIHKNITLARYTSI